MKSTDRTILFALPLIALAIGFYLLVLSPKQKEAGELQDKIDSLNSEITLAESEISTAESARAAFSKNYADIVKLGTAVPEDDDQATLISDLNEMGANNDLDFQSFQISDDAAATEAPTAPAPTETVDRAPTPPPRPRRRPLPRRRPRPRPRRLPRRCRSGRRSARPVSPSPPTR